MSHTGERAYRKEKMLIREIGGVFRASEAIKAGVSRKALYAMRDTGLIESLSRGVYRLMDAKSLASPDLVIVARRVPNGVVCLISALSFHRLTTQIPHEVHIAIRRGKKRPPRIDYPPVRAFQFSDSAYSEGIELHQLDGTKVRIYSIEKTLADTFKFRGKIGLDIFLEALKNWQGLRRKKLNDLLHFSKLNRIEKQIRPYLEAIQ